MVQCPRAQFQRHQAGGEEARALHRVEAKDGETLEDDLIAFLIHQSGPLGAWASRQCQRLSSNWGLSLNWCLQTPQWTLREGSKMHMPDFMAIQNTFNVYVASCK